MGRGGIMKQKEKEICNMLKLWIEETSGNKVFLNYGEKRFKTKGCRNKPDLIVWSKKMNGYIAIEVKTAITNKNLFDSVKIISYWKQYCQGKIKYFIDNEEINIKSFCISTPYSLYGRLYETDYEIVKSKNRIPVEMKLIPPLEFRRTKDFIRILWAVWGLYERKKNEDLFDTRKAGIGIIVSKTLYDETMMKYNVVCSPMIFNLRNKLTSKGDLKWLQEIQIL